MFKTLSHSGSATPLLDISSYARRGPGQRDRLSPEEIELIERTVRRTPEVMVKVLSRGGQDAKSVGKHFAYLSRKGDLKIETDDGRYIEGKGAEAELLEDWDLDLQEQRPTSSLGAGLNRKVPKLVHKVLFSMLPGTPPKKVLEAVKVFARDEFGVNHRYAMVLHTDEPHPHVHLVVKAVSEDGVRLNIRKATLRGWRQEFARQLRNLGVAASATPRAVRGVADIRKLDGIYRAALRGNSTHCREREETVESEIASGRFHADTGQRRLIETRRDVLRGWAAVERLLLQQDQQALASTLRQFVARMARPSSDKAQVLRRMRGREFNKALFARDR